jgi:hypothetical protein
MPEAQPMSSKLVKFFAHPAVVTVLAGIVIALLTTFFQFLSAKTQQELAVERQLQNEKCELLVAVADGVHSDVIVLHEIKRMKGWLSNHRDGDIFEQALTRSEVWTLYQKVFEQYVKENRTSALMTQVQALFKSRQVLEDAKALDELVTNIDINLSPESETDLIKKLDQFYTDADAALRKLEKAMADEINNI